MLSVFAVVLLQQKFVSVLDPVNFQFFNSLFEFSDGYFKVKWIYKSMDVYRLINNQMNDMLLTRCRKFSASAGFVLVNITCIREIRHSYTSTFQFS